VTLQRVQRFDRGRLSRAGTTPTGGAALRANVSRTGIQAYRMPDDSVRREFRPPEEVFHPDSLSSFVGAALTIGHPDRVTPKTWSKVAVGFVPSVPERVKLSDGQEYAATTVHVTRDDALTGVDGGELEELSAGYSADFDPTPGVDPVTGEKFDGVQRNIRLNHVALLPYGKARAGRNARLLTDGNETPDELRLDSDGNQILDREPEPERSRMKFSINGKTYDAGPELQAEIGALEADRNKHKDRADGAEATAATASAKADKAETERKDAADKFDARVADEVNFRSRVAPILVDDKGAAFDFASKSRRDVQLAVVKKLRPAKEFAKDASDITVAAYFDAVIEDWKPTDGTPSKSESYAPPKSKDDRADALGDKLYTDEDAWAEHLASLHLAPTKDA
jgi:uncharacterized protein